MLALALGKTVEELLSSLDSQELTLWAALYGLDPWGEGRADLRSGIIAATVANCHRGKGKAYTPSDFIPTFNKPKPATSLADLRSWVLRNGKPQA